MECGHSGEALRCTDSVSVKLNKAPLSSLSLLIEPESFRNSGVPLWRLAEACGGLKGGLSERFFA